MPGGGFGVAGWPYLECVTGLLGGYCRGDANFHVVLDIELEGVKGAKVNASAAASAFGECLEAAAIRIPVKPYGAAVGVPAGMGLPA